MLRLQHAGISDAPEAAPSSAGAAPAGSERGGTADAAPDPAPAAGHQPADSEGPAVDGGEVGLPASPEPPTIVQTSDGRPGSGSSGVGAGQAAGSARAPDISLTTQGSDGRRGSGGRRASGGSASLGAGQTGGSELTFGAQLSGRRSASSQGDAALSRLPPVEDVAAEARLLAVLACDGMTIAFLRNQDTTCDASLAHDLMLVDASHT